MRPQIRLLLGSAWRFGESDPVPQIATCHQRIALTLLAVTTLVSYVINFTFGIYGNTFTITQNTLLLQLLEALPPALPLGAQPPTPILPPPQYPGSATDSTQLV